MAQAEAAVVQAAQAVPVPAGAPLEPLSVVIGAGGTGGHIYPGLALAEALKRAAPGARISFVGTERGLETRLIPEAGYRLHTVDMIPFDPALGAKRFLLPAALLRAGAQCRSVLRRQGAQVAVGMGGYPSAPVILGAKFAGLPSVIHESNAVPGRANLFAARLTDHVALAFDRAAPHFAGSGGPSMRTVGMPLVSAVSALDGLDAVGRAAFRTEALARLGIPEGRRVVLVNGGSLGSARINEAVLELAGRWAERTDVALLVKTGPDALDASRRRLAENGGERVATAVAYLDRMDLAYAAADLTICRAGSSTVAELAHVGLPAVLVPYPYAPHDHQTHNARTLVDAGAGVLLPDAETTATRLAELVEPLLADPVRLTAMGAAARAGAHADAADRLAEWVLGLARRGAATSRAAKN